MLTTMADELRALRLHGSDDRSLPNTPALVFVQRGKAAAFDGEAWHIARAGDAMVLPRASRVRLLERGSEAVAFVTPTTEGSAHENRSRDSVVLPKVRIDDHPRARDIAALLVGTKGDDDPRVTAHLVEAFRSCADRMTGGSHAALPCTDEVVRRAIALVTESLSRRWTLEDLARACGVSRSVLHRRFRDALGTSPERYFTDLRLEKAAERLVWTDDGQAEIADAVGYKSPFAFNRAFKRRFGVAPGIYRKQARNELRATPIRCAA